MKLAMKSQRQLLGKFLHHMAPGELSWIGVRPERKAPLMELERVLAIKDRGLEGDHRCDKTPGSARQVTLISAEFIQQIAHFTGSDQLHPGILRRNLVVKNINLHALRFQQFYIGDVLLEATALCHPCSRMEAALGKGGVAAMLGHGGLCAKIISGGELQLGQSVRVVAPQLDLF